MRRANGSVHIKSMMLVAIAALVVGGLLGALISHQLFAQNGTGVSVTTTTEPFLGANPTDAISNYLAARGHSYSGDCSKSQVPEDVGSYCSLLRASSDVTRNYLVGAVASEGDIFVLAHSSGGWQVVFVSVTSDLVP